MLFRTLLVVLTLMIGPLAMAADPLPSLSTLQGREARRFPQPVVVGNLIGRAVLKPIEAMALMGPFMAVMDFTPEQLGTFPTSDGAGLQPVPAGETIRVGIVKPFH